MEAMTLIQQLRGRAAYLRDKGRVKSPGLMEQAANALEAHLAQPAQAMDVGAVYSEGVCGDGAAILCNGLPMRVHEIVAALNATRALSVQKAGPVGDGWQPIETAPKDGSAIILGYAGSHSCEGFWMGDASRNHWGETGWFDSDSDVLCEHAHKPTHWMPLPASPTPDKEGQP